MFLSAVRSMLYFAVTAIWEARKRFSEVSSSAPLLKQKKEKNPPIGVYGDQMNPCSLLVDLKVKIRIPTREVSSHRRSEEHRSELQTQIHLVFRLLLGT